MEGINIKSNVGYHKVNPLRWIKNFSTTSPTAGTIAYTKDGFVIADYVADLDFFAEWAVSYNPYNRVIIRRPSDDFLNNNANTLFPIGAAVKVSNENKSNSINEKLKNQEIWQKNFATYSISEFLGSFSLQYHMEEYEKIFDFLMENRFLAPLISEVIYNIENVYFKDENINFSLGIQTDPDSDSESLYLNIRSSGNLKKNLENLLNFQKDWFLANMGTKIHLFNVNIV